MKKYLLTGALITITATTLYATTAGSTVVDKMKAAAHSFTLATSLNPTDTGLTSDPVKGKKTGDILTAGEYNRILELVSEGGSGGGSGWVDVPLTDTADFDDSCMYRYQITYSAGGREPYVPKETYYYANGMSKTQLVWWLDNDSQNTTYHIASSSKNILRINGAPYPTGGVSVTKIEKLCGGGGGGSSGGTSNITWANFDGSGGVAMKGSNGIASIIRESTGNYRVTFATPRPNTDYGIICTSGPSPSYLCFPHEKSTTSFLIKTSNPSNNVDASFVSLIVTPFDVGTGSSSGSVRPSSIDSSDRGPATFMSAFNQCKSEGKYLPTAEEALYFVFGGAGTIQNPTSNPLWTISPDDARDTFVTVYSSGSGMDHTGALSTPYSTTATAYYRCVTGGGGSSSSSGWSDISLTGATPFDINCEYRFKASAPGNVDDDAYIGDDNAYNYIQRVHANRLTYQHIGTSYEHINADTKTTLRQNGNPTNPLQTITQIQKRCN